MTNAPISSKVSFFQIAMPVAAMALAGLSLGYSIRGDSPVNDNIGSVANSVNTVAVAQTPSAESSPMADRQLDVVHRAPVALRPLDADIAPSLARLHMSLGDLRAQQADRDRQVGELDREHKAEPVDSKWSAQSETDILSASIQPVMLESGLTPQDVATDCRASTCRISARFPVSADAESWGNMLITSMSGTMSQAKMAIMPLPDGSSEVRIYSAHKQPSRG